MSRFKPYLDRIRPYMTRANIPRAIALVAVLAILALFAFGPDDPDPVVTGNAPSASVEGTDAEPASPSASVEVAGVCTDRVFLGEGGASKYGTITRSGIGPISVHHVYDSPSLATIVGPDHRVVRGLEATDFVFLEGSDPAASPDAFADFVEGERLIAEGFPARATVPVTATGIYHAADTVPPGRWMLLDGKEPMVGGVSGGCVRRPGGQVVAVIMGASSMHFEGRVRHFIRIVPVRDGLREAQGHDWEGTAPLSLLSKPVPEFVAGRWGGMIQ